jgi:phosphoribosyl-ATP pyrophosphohydrolase/phosphoribosyl-AMP cyclohydrolase/histidinol dehydrogenase
MDLVRDGGEPALLRLARELDRSDGRLWYGPEDFAAALSSIGADQRGALERAAKRIQVFAKAQLASLSELDLPVPGGRAGHQLLPVERAGCYVPGGRYPLPSTVLMTAGVARVAGVQHVAVACPSPQPIILAACAVVGVDLLLAAGGAQAIAALTWGCGALAPRDVVVGPGNRYVAAAKRLAQSVVRTDPPAGPSELLVLADDSADPSAVAWDLLAQAEHDPDAVPALAALSEAFISKVESALAANLAEMPAPAAEIARAALDNGWAFVAMRPEELAEAANRFVPEHLELAMADPDSILPLCKQAGAVFIGSGSAEAFGDYGAGPNHTLPTSGRGRGAGGLSVFDFLRIRTWLRLDGRHQGGQGQTTSEAVGKELVDRELAALASDTAVLARAEGLEAHARSALARVCSEA